MTRLNEAVSLENLFSGKKYYMFKTLANRSRRVRDACEDFAIPCERFATVRDGLANRFANPSGTRRIPVR